MPAEVEEDDDYDTEPLPENDTECKLMLISFIMPCKIIYWNRVVYFFFFLGNIEPEPIACGSRDRTPSPKRVARVFVEPKGNV